MEGDPLAPASLPLTLFCLPGEVADARATGDALLVVKRTWMPAPVRVRGGGKSPGISPYRQALAAACGTQFIGGTTLWFGERPMRARCA